MEEVQGRWYLVVHTNLYVKKSIFLAFEGLFEAIKPSRCALLSRFHVTGSSQSRIVISAMEGVIVAASLLYYSPVLMIVRQRLFPCIYSCRY